jgi:hypothetical protein
LQQKEINMNRKTLSTIAATAVTVLILVLVFVPETRFWVDNDQNDEPSAVPNVPARPVSTPTVAPSTQPVVSDASKGRYEADREKWLALTKLWEDNLALKQRVDDLAAPAEQKEAAQKLIDDIVAQPPPPPPEEGNAASLDNFEKWSEEFEQDVAEKSETGGLGALISAACPVAAAAFAAPEAAGLCSIIAPLLQGLGLALGQGDDIQEIGAAIQAMEQGNFGPMREVLRKRPEIAQDLNKFLSVYDKYGPAIREAVFWTSSGDPNAICSSLKGVIELSDAQRRTRLEKAIQIAPASSREALRQCLDQI